jgi:hypothetical protein
MVEFGKSRQYEKNFYVSKGDATVYFNKKEIGELKSCLEAAVDPNTGTGSWVCSRDSNGNQSKVIAENHSIILDNGIGYRVNLTYTEARDLVQQIEETVLRESVLERKLKDMKR